MSREFRVVVAGAAGKMGSEVVKAVTEAEDTHLVAAVDPGCVGRDAGEVAGIGPLGVTIVADLGEAIAQSHPNVLVDFTQPSSVLENVLIAVDRGVHAVVGTTGLSDSEWVDIDRLAKARGVGVLHAPNFAIGAVLMTRFAREAARFFPQAEIVEMHHDRKKDAPSGTSLHTAEEIASAWEASPPRLEDEVEIVKGARGGRAAGGVPIHSVRLPGYVAHQEVIFGLPGQTLTLRHDSIDRRSFMPGVLVGIRKVEELHGVHKGLEDILF